MTESSSLDILSIIEQLHQKAKTRQGIPQEYFRVSTMNLQESLKNIMGEENKQLYKALDEIVYQLKQRLSDTHNDSTLQKIIVELLQGVINMMNTIKDADVITTNLNILYSDLPSIIDAILEKIKGSDMTNFNSLLRDIIGLLQPTENNNGPQNNNNDLQNNNNDSQNNNNDSQNNNNDSQNNNNNGPQNNDGPKTELEKAIKKRHKAIVRFVQSYKFLKDMDHYRILNEINKDKEYAGYMQLMDIIEEYNASNEAVEKLINKLVVGIARMLSISGNENTKKMMIESVRNMGINLENPKQKLQTQSGGEPTAATTGPAVDVKKILKSVVKSFNEFKDLTNDVRYKYEQSQLYKSKNTNPTTNNIYQDFEKEIKADINTTKPGEKVDNSKYYGLFEQISKEKDLVDNILLKNIDSAKNAFESIKKNLLQIVNSDKNDAIFAEIITMIDKLDEDISETKDVLKSTSINDHLTQVSKDIKNEYFALTTVIQPYKIQLDKRFEQEKIAANANVKNLQIGGGLGIIERLTYIETKYKDIQDIINKISRKISLQLDPVHSSLAANPLLFKEISADYNRSKTTDGPVIAALVLEQALKQNDLIPADVLKVSTLDKAIFIFVILMLRLFAISAVEYLIQKSWIKTTTIALLAFGVVYTVLFGAFVFAVNFDLYRFRIMFNYVNLHGNSSIILAHLFELWIFVFLIYTVITNVNIPLPGLSNENRMSNEDMSYLMYKLEIITMLTWIFIIMFVFIF